MSLSWVVTRELVGCASRFHWFGHSHIRSPPSWRALGLIDNGDNFSHAAGVGAARQVLILLRRPALCAHHQRLRTASAAREGHAAAGRVLGDAQSPARRRHSLPMAPPSRVRADADAELARHALHRRPHRRIRRRRSRAGGAEPAAHLGQPRPRRPGRAARGAGDVVPAGMGGAPSAACCANSAGLQACSKPLALERRSGFRRKRRPRRGR